MKRIALCAALTAAFPACAVTLNDDGLGQALIYPYYTAQSSRGDPYNTYISVVNHTADAKALRLRFREGRLGKPVLDMNVYLAPNDVWTGAVVPFAEGTRLLTADNSCAEPGFTVEPSASAIPFMAFRNDAFSGGNDDGAGAGLDRTREGFVEIIEMGKLTGAAAAAVTHNSAGVPSNCAAVTSLAPQVEAPTGGLSGTLTLINIASGMDFTVNAEALDELAGRPYFRRADDPYPDFNATEIDPISVVQANGAVYRSAWPRPVDAVSAVLMRSGAMGEYVLDEPTASLTDFVLTFPTRHFYATATGASPPFTGAARWSASCSPAAEAVSGTWFNREESASAPPGLDFGGLPPQPVLGTCGSVNVAPVINNGLAHIAHGSRAANAVLGSINQGLNVGGIGGILITSNAVFHSGWILLQPFTNSGPQGMSTSSSSRIDGGAAQPIAGGQRFSGLPMVGFSVRIFRNGTLRCDAGSCQGNYGGAFPFKYRRSITPAS